jgi:hypothetical protein
VFAFVRELLRFQHGRPKKAQFTQNTGGVKWYGGTRRTGGY